MNASLRPMAALLLLLASLPPGTAHADAGIIPRAEMREHVAQVARSLAPHLGSAMRDPVVEIEEQQAALCRAAPGRLVVSTGLLAVLESDAQLAMILGTALADTSSSATTPKQREQAADQAAIRGMRALVAAGWDGAEALRAWDRLDAASILGTTGDAAGALAVDARSTARRKQAATRALRVSNQRARPGAGLATGADAYRQDILSRLLTWKLAPTSAPVTEPRGIDPPPPPVTTAPREGGTKESPELLVLYRRSGGFTGWMAELRIGEDGSRWISESQRKAEEGPASPVAAATIAELRELTARVSAKPPRAMTQDARMMRDGQVRSVEVRSGSGWKSIALSDGLGLTDDDHRLVRLLEDLLR